MINLNSFGQEEQDCTDELLVYKQKVCSFIPWWHGVNYADVLDEVKGVYEGLSSSFDHVLVLGIGGSALGTISVINALGKNQKVTVLDSIDPDHCQKIFDGIEWSKTVINVISKSGSTIETLAQLSAVSRILDDLGVDKSNHIIITTGEKKGKLGQYAKAHNIKTLNVPKSIGGRFSVFSQVSLFPLLFAGVDIDKFVGGFRQVVGEFLASDTSLAFSFAASQIDAYEKDSKNIHVFMTYNRSLFGVLEWYRQLLAESIGKSDEIGITPVLAFGSTDQHSQLQLYLDGPRDKFFTFLNTSFSDGPLTGEDFDEFKNKSFGEMQQAFLQGTLDSFIKNDIGFMDINISSLDEDSLARFMTSMMLNILLLAEYFGVNAYDQPAVEYGKKQAIEKLAMGNC